MKTDPTTNVKSLGFPSFFTSGPICEAPGGYFICTRRKGHAGRHAAGGGAIVLRVWP